jgi:hypothetical protein
MCFWLTTHKHLPMCFRFLPSIIVICLSHIELHCLVVSTSASYTGGAGFER